MNAEGERHEVDFGMEDGLLRSAAEKGEEEQGKQGRFRSAKVWAAWALFVHEASVNTLLRTAEVPEILR